MGGGVIDKELHVQSPGPMALPHIVAFLLKRRPMHNPLSQDHANPGDGASARRALVRLTEAAPGSTVQLDRVPPDKLPSRGTVLLSLLLVSFALCWCDVYLSTHPKCRGEDDIYRL